MSDSEAVIIKSKSQEATRRKRLKFKEEEVEEDEIMQAPAELVPWAADKEVGEGLISTTSANNTANTAQVKSLESIIEQQEEFERQRQADLLKSEILVRERESEDADRDFLLKGAIIATTFIAGFFLMKWLFGSTASAKISSKSAGASVASENSKVALQSALSAVSQ